MPDVNDLLVTDSRFVRKWGKYLLAVADYSAPVPATFSDENGLPVLPPGVMQLGKITTDGIQHTNNVSSASVYMDQDIEPVRSDVEQIEKTLVVTFGETNAWTEALWHGVPLSDWPALPYGPSDFHDGDFVDYPYLRLYLFAQDGKGAQAFYKVEIAYRAKVMNLGNRQTQRRAAETYQLTFGLFRDPVAGRSTRVVRFGPGYTNLIPPTGATAGTPGSFTPPGAYAPANLAALQTSGIAASPSSAWSTGQHVVLGDNSHAHWDGDSWEAGDAP